MSDSEQIQILSRLTDDESLVREEELRQLYSIAKARDTRHALVVGGPRAGKTELLKKSYDRLFVESADVVPIYFNIRSTAVGVEQFARDFLAGFLAQFIAFRRRDPRLIATADSYVTDLSSAAAPDCKKRRLEICIRLTPYRDADFQWKLPAQCLPDAPGLSRQDQLGANSTRIC